MPLVSQANKLHHVQQPRSQPTIFFFSSVKDTAEIQKNNLSWMSCSLLAQFLSCRISLTGHLDPFNLYLFRGASAARIHPHMWQKYNNKQIPFGWGGKPSPLLKHHLSISRKPLPWSPWGQATMSPVLTTSDAISPNLTITSRNSFPSVNDKIASHSYLDLILQLWLRKPGQLFPYPVGQWIWLGLLQECWVIRLWLLQSNFHHNSLSP